MFEKQFPYFLIAEMQQSNAEQFIQVNYQLNQPNNFRPTQPTIHSGTRRWMPTAHWDGVNNDGYGEKRQTVWGKNNHHQQIKYDPARMQ